MSKYVAGPFDDDDNEDDISRWYYCKGRKEKKLIQIDH